MCAIRLIAVHGLSGGDWLSVRTNAAPVTVPPVVLMSGLGNWHHEVTTSNPEAQKFFDQGLTLVYAFNHDDAIRSFGKARSWIRRWRWRIGESLMRSVQISILMLIHRAKF